ncbi:CheR family methyltransferase [Geobacter sp. DSM 9736]|uniref:CheR family methyltransferase n=1 Tax=Geobacter sp. DSM 9736 TaxID=1277350 RepID=UPI000B50CCD5|nr:CheR family methyltransferase [Geobacter sp. DSM 9736]SNB44747.1 MCP methyltransferase, CheR-type [Geobacter sp. DSM 9736]
MTQRRISEELLLRFSEYISLHMGLRFPRERHSDLMRGIGWASREFGFDDDEDCVRWLMQAPLSKHQVEILASHLTIGETYFFRDPKMFETLERDVFPPLIRDRRGNGRHLRIWSAGCATGEEPYSVAILLSRLLPDMEEWNITILGTDINPGFLRKAREGIYGDWSFRSVAPRIRERYFTAVAPRRYRIVPSLQDCVTFSYLNLADDLYPSLLNRTNAMDLIFCRNVLMYFTQQQQADVVRKFHRCLVHRGILAASPTESSPSVFSPFSEMRLPGWVYYVKEGEDGRVRPAPPSSRVSAPQMTISQQRPIVAPPGSAARKAPEPAPPPPPSDLYRDAEEAYRSGRYGDAEEMLKELMVRDARSSVIELMARVQANLGRLQRARELCEQAISGDKLNAGLYVLLATILQEMDLAEEEDLALKRALYLDHDLIVAHFARGNLALRRTARREADRHFGYALLVLERMGRDDVVPLTEGITAGRMREMITTAMTGRTAV